MTVQSTTARADYQGNNVTTLFTVPFYFLDNTHLKVVRTDNSSSPPTVATLVIGTDYVVVGAGAQIGGTVQTTVAPTAAQVLTVLRSVPFTQLIHYVPNDPFPAATHEQALDQLTMEVQELNEITSHALQLPTYEAPPSTIPAAASRANTVLGFGPLGQIQLTPVPTSVGAGDLRVEEWTDGSGYTSGVSNSVTLSRSYGTKANLGSVVMQGIVQDPASYSLSGTTLTFNAVIPAGVSQIWCIGGTTLSTTVPPDNSVGDTQLAWGSILPRVLPSVSALQNLDVTKYQRAVTNAYYVGGQGAGDYYYDPSFSQANSNGGTAVASLVGAGCWRLIRRGVVDLFQFGAKGDDVADDTNAVNAAITWAFANSERIRVPVAPKAFRLTSTITLPGNIHIEGDGVFPYTGSANASITTVTIGPGPWFHINHTGVGFYAIGGSQQFATFYKGIGTYRDQPTPNGAAAFAPNNNNWDFYNDNVDLHMDDVFCLNPTRFSYTTGGSRATYKMIRGQPLTQGIYTDNAYDVCQYDQIRFWPWWSQALGVRTWTLANAAGLTFARNDTPMLSNLFTIFYFAGIKITSNANGTTTGLKCVNTDFDAANYGLFIDGSVTGFDGQFTNFRTQGIDATSGRGVYAITGSSNCVMKFNNFRAGFYGAEGIRLDGTGHVVFMGAGSSVDQWNLSNTGFSAYYANTTCTFRFVDAPYTSSPTGSPTPLGGPGVFKGSLGWAQFNGSTDGNGQVTITHNLGATPTGALTSVINGSVGITCQQVSANQTQIVFQFRTATSNAALILTAIAFSYELIY